MSGQTKQVLRTSFGKTPAQKVEEDLLKGAGALQESGTISGNEQVSENTQHDQEYLPVTNVEKKHKSGYKEYFVLDDDIKGSKKVNIGIDEDIKGILDDLASVEGSNIYMLTNVILKKWIQENVPSIKDSLNKKKKNKFF